MLEREEGTGWAAAWFSLYLDINPQKKKKKTEVGGSGKESKSYFIGEIRQGNEAGVL